MRKVLTSILFVLETEKMRHREAKKHALGQTVVSAEREAENPGEKPPQRHTAVSRAGAEVQRPKGHCQVTREASDPRLRVQHQNRRLLTSGPVTRDQLLEGRSLINELYFPFKYVCLNIKEFIRRVQHL